MPECPLFIVERAQSNNCLFTSDEVAQWPVGLLDELVSKGVLRSAQPAKSITCDSCGDDHIECVEYVKSSLNSELRAYISCPAVGRVFVPLARLQQWTVDPTRLPSVSQRETTSHFVDEPLGERAQDVLIAMLECRAIDSDNRLSTDDIAAKALGEHADANSLKSVMSELKTRQYVQSKTGRGGGCWLTGKGRVRAQKLRSV